MLPELVTAGGYLIRGDITSQMMPFVYETKRMFASGEPFWSWNTYFGDNFIASYAYYTVFNPFTWINCLFPYKYLGLGFTLVLYLKFLVCGFVSQKYLLKIGFNERLSLIGSLLYTFSSWAITNLFYYMFMEPMILFPFLLIFVERFLRKEKHKNTGLALATFVVVAVNYYFASVNLIAAAIYFFCRLLAMYKGSSERLWMSLSAIGCLSLGIICASFVVIPVLIQLEGSPHKSFKFDVSDITMIADRIFWLIYPKTHEGPYHHIILTSAWRNNAASIAVFGLLPMLLLFKKKGYVWVKWLIVILLLLYVTPLNGLFSLFTNCYYTRWAYSLSLSIIICTLYYIRDFEMPRFRYAVWYCIAVYGAYLSFVTLSIYWHYHHSSDLAYPKITRLAMDMILIGMNAVALLLLCNRRMNLRSQYASTVIAIAICTSLQFFVFSIHGMRDFSTDTSTFNGHLRFYSDKELNVNKDFSYRTNFTLMQYGDNAGYNLGLIYDKPSIETYHSVQNPKIHKWKEIVGDTIYPKCVFYPLNFVKSFEAMMSVKDIMVVSGKTADSTTLGIPDICQDIFTKYESDHYIPMGFCYDKYIFSDEVEDIAKRDTSVDIPKILLSVLAIDRADEKGLMPYLKKGDIDTNLSLDSLVSARSAETCDNFIGHARGFDAHIDLDTTGIVFFSVLADPGFRAYIDGVPTKIYETNLGFSSVIVPAGSHDITFRYFTPGLKLGMLISLIGFVTMGFLFYKKL